MFCGTRGCYQPESGAICDIAATKSTFQLTAGVAADVGLRPAARRSAMRRGPASRGRLPDAARRGPFPAAATFPTPPLLPQSTPRPHQHPQDYYTPAWRQPPPSITHCPLWPPSRLYSTPPSRPSPSPTPNLPRSQQLHFHIQQLREHPPSQKENSPACHPFHQYQPFLVKSWLHQPPLPAQTPAPPPRTRTPTHHHQQRRLVHSSTSTAFGHSSIKLQRLRR